MSSCVFIQKSHSSAVSGSSSTKAFVLEAEDVGTLAGHVDTESGKYCILGSRNAARNGFLEVVELVEWYVEL